MGKSKKEWGVHNQIGKHVGHFYQEMEGLRISSMHGIYSVVWDKGWKFDEGWLS